MKTPRSFAALCTRLAAGNTAQVLEVLDAPDLEPRQRAYVRAWCHVLAGQWDQAGQVLFSPGVSKETITDLRLFGPTERRRKSSYLLALGDMAVTLARYEEASQHHALCLKCLDERRMNHAHLRLRALLGLGLAQTMIGSYASALTSYQEALRLCGKNPRSEHVPTIYYGLCDIYHHQGQYAHALDAGKQALQLATKRGEMQLVCQVRHSLGRIYAQMGNVEEANACLFEALALALRMGSRSVILHTYIALADLSLQEGKPEEAWHYCEIALVYTKTAQRASSLGKLYFMCGKVAEARANAAEEQGWTQEAIAYYEQAVERLRSDDPLSDRLAEVYGRLAEVLETAGQLGKAWEALKAGYQIARGGLSLTGGDVDPLA